MGDGRLTVTQGVMVTGKSFDEVETCLHGMTRSGYADVDNGPSSGVVVYVFPELVGRPSPVKRERRRRGVRSRCCRKGEGVKDGGL